MGQVRHGSATTTHAVRAAIHRSQASLATLSRDLGINPKTVAKWRKRQTVEDLGKSLEPQEKDWDDDGQDEEREALFGERLRRKLSNVTFETKKAELPDIKSGR